MIKKSVFENDLISGMERELHAQHTQEKQAGVVKAVEHLHSAMDILAKAGLNSRAGAIGKILKKMAAPHHKEHTVKHFPVNIGKLMEAGVTQKDLAEFSKGSPAAKAKVLQTLRGLGVDDKMIGEMIGHHNVIPKEDAESIADPNRSFGKMWDWMQEPTSPLSPDPTELRPEEESDFLRRYKTDSTIPFPKKELTESEEFDQQHSPEIGQELKLERLAQAFNEVRDEADARHKSHKTPAPGKSKINDPHVKGLTSEKMVENLKHHGTVFNMANDGKAEQLLNSDVTDDDDGTLEVSDADSNLEMDFEDEI